MNRKASIDLPTMYERYVTVRLRYGTVRYATVRYGTTDFYVLMLNNIYKCVEFREHTISAASAWPPP